MKYTEEELLKAIEYACGYQKASDYQNVGHYLMAEFKSVEEADSAITKVLDELADTNNNSANQITIEDINTYLNE